MLRDDYFTAKNKGEQPTFEGKALFRVPDSNFPGLQQRIEKINRKATKLGLPTVQMEVVGTDEQNVTDEITGVVTAIIRFTYVTVQGETVKLNGWALAAAVDHLTGEGNMIRTVPGVEIDTTPYREADPNCDHCGWNRRRHTTYIVKHDDGTVKQVGSNCLGDFTGANDPEKAARMAEWLIEIFAAASESEGSGSGVEVISLKTWLAYVSAIIERDGWISASRAWDEDRSSTRQTAEREYYSRNSTLRVTEENWEEAEGAIEWARENVCNIPVEDRDDFQHNMAVVFSRDFVMPKGMGIAAYAPVARRWAIEAEIRRARRAQSDFVGEVGKKLTTTVTIVRVVELENNYAMDGSTKPLYIMLDPNGNEIKWFCSNWKNRMEQGHDYEITGTVKGHQDDPKFGKSTLLTRCKTREAVNAS